MSGTYGQAGINARILHLGHIFCGHWRPWHAFAIYMHQESTRVRLRGGNMAFPRLIVPAPCICNSLDKCKQFAFNAAVVARTVRSTDSPAHAAHGRSAGSAALAADPLRDQAKALLTQRGLRTTEQRLAVMVTLLRAGRPVTAQDLITGLSELFGPARLGIDFATVYRTVNTFVAHKVVRQVGTTERGRRYELPPNEDCQVQHPHLQCRGCGSMTCLPHEGWAAALIPPDIAGFWVENVTLCLTGLCATCRSSIESR